jgi:hypothetical protein
MSRCDLTEFEWRVIAPLLPNKPRGVARVDVRVQSVQGTNERKAIQPG